MVRQFIDSIPIRTKSILIRAFARIFIHLFKAKSFDFNYFYSDRYRFDSDREGRLLIRARANATIGFVQAGCRRDDVGLFFKDHVEPRHLDLSKQSTGPREALGTCIRNRVRSKPNNFNVFALIVVTKGGKGGYPSPIKNFVCSFRIHSGTTYDKRERQTTLV